MFKGKGNLFYTVKHFYHPAGGKEMNHQITRQKVIIGQISRLLAICNCT